MWSSRDHKLTPGLGPSCRLAGSPARADRSKAAGSFLAAIAAPGTAAERIAGCTWSGTAGCSSSGLALGATAAGTDTRRGRTGTGVDLEDCSTAKLAVRVVERSGCCTSSRLAVADSCTGLGWMGKPGVSTTLSQLQLLPSEALRLCSRIQLDPSTRCCRCSDQVRRRGSSAPLLPFTQTLHRSLRRVIPPDSGSIHSQSFRPSNSSPKVVHVLRLT